MRLVVRVIDGSYEVIDSAQRIARISKPINELKDIYTARWVSTTDEPINEEYIEVTEEASSFKQLRHYVTKAIMDDIPHGHIQAYIRNHLKE